MKNLSDDFAKVIFNLDAVKDIKNACIMNPADESRLYSELSEVVSRSSILHSPNSFLGIRVFSHGYLPVDEVLMIDTIKHALEILERLDELQSKKWPWQMALVPARMEP